MRYSHDLIRCFRLVARAERAGFEKIRRDLLVPFLDEIIRLFCPFSGNNDPFPRDEVQSQFRHNKNHITKEEDYHDVLCERVGRILLQKQSFHDLIGESSRFILIRDGFPNVLHGKSLDSRLRTEGMTNNLISKHSDT